MNAALEKAIQLVNEGEHDPVRAVRHLETIGKLLRRAAREGGSTSVEGDRLARILERMTEDAQRPLSPLGATHIVRVDDVPRLDAGQTSPALKVDWPGGQGTARSLFAGTVDGNEASLSQVSVRIAINGSDDLFTTGSAPTYVPLVAFHSTTHNWFRLKDYAVSPAQKWTINFQHEGPAGSAPIQPFLLFGYVRQKE